MIEDRPGRASELHAPRVEFTTQSDQRPAVAVVKSASVDLATIPGIVRQMYVDKGFSGGAVNALGGTARELIASNTVKVHGRNIASIAGLGNYGNLVPQYTGTPEENRAIDSAIAGTRGNGNAREQTKRGASLLLRSADIVVPSEIAETPIHIIGAGPAGLVTARELVGVGFTKVVIFEGNKKNGIWSEDNVGISEASRNNPADIVYQTKNREYRIPAAPGNAKVITTFLDRISDGDWSTKPLDVRSATVTDIVPGDLQHIVHYTTSTGEEKSVTSPIVINAIGLGQPVPANRPGIMETSATGEQAGIRWQERITPDMAEKLRGKTITTIGLGNSTAEMMVQIKRLNEKGYNIDFRVVTHYPQQSLNSPNESHEVDGRTYKVFRDTTNLGRYAGDLEEPRNVYINALRGGKIIADVVRWEPDGKNLMFHQRDGSVGQISYDRLYNLTGTRIDPKILERMGINVTDPESTFTETDYDGEFQREPGIPGRDRVYPGYYGIGAILRSPSNPNAPVIPGILHRVPDLVSGVVIRAMEHALAR